jgi:D-alanyl-D-alanine carboxypeptidase (penicillin-binding protein 5/6)
MARLFSRTVFVALAAFLLSAAGAMAGKAYIVVDARTAKVVLSENADAPNGPASLTKMMTLYLTFEALRTGRLGWDDPVPISRQAIRTVPFKLGAREGEAITVRDAVLGMIVLSANDAAVAMAEKLGGSEERFAEMMTAKARRLGMRQTTFRNASGLTSPGQVTTARDMALLGLALMKNFPREFRLFSTRSFIFRGRTIEGHNDLMDEYPGVDGIKTGYTSASGYNLVTSLHKGNRRLVGVVMGGSSAKSRNRSMAGLLDSALVGGSGRPAVAVPLTPGLY